MKIQLKRSNVLDGGAAKEPTAAQMEFGELAVNYNTADPAIFLKDEAGNIIRVAGIGNISDDGQVELPSTINPPANPLPGNLWFNADDGRLYIYYDDGNTAQWVDASPDSWNPSDVPDLDGDDNQPGTLDDRYLKLGAGAGAQVVESPDPTEFKGGVKVSGGTFAEVQEGILSTNYTTKQSYLCAGGADSYLVVDSNGTSGVNASNPASAFNIASKQQDTFIGVRYIKDLITENKTQEFGYFTNPPQVDPANTVDKLSAYYAGVPNSYRCGTKTIGYESDVKISVVSGQSNYNFYAAGSAPNYFAGLVESAGGVKVSGGSLSSVEDGMYLLNGAVNLAVGGKSGLVLVDGTLYASGTGNPLAGTASKIVASGNIIPKADGSANAVVINNYTGLEGTVNNYVFNTASFNTGGGGTVSSECIGYTTATNLEQIAPTNIGFKSVLRTVGGKDNFNFYAEGTAPNYFRGNVFIGDLPAATSYNTSTTDKSISYIAGSGVVGNPENASIRVQATTGSAVPILTTWNIDQSIGGSIQKAGNGDLSFVNPSDYRFKSNIVDLPNASDTIKALKPRQYTFKETPDQIGFIAHELQEVLPDAVTGVKDGQKAIGKLCDWDGTVIFEECPEPPAEELTYTEDIEVDGVSTATVRTRSWTATGTRPAYQGVDQTKLIPLLTKALQESLDKIDALEARLNAAGIA